MWMPNGINGVNGMNRKQDAQAYEKTNYIDESKTLYVVCTPNGEQLGPDVRRWGYGK